jgi:hypothetical protein
VHQQPPFTQLSFSNLRTSASATALHADAEAVLSFSFGNSAASIRDSSFSNFSDSAAGQLAATAFIRLMRQRSVYGTQLQRQRPRCVHICSSSSVSKLQRQRLRCMLISSSSSFSKLQRQRLRCVHICSSSSVSKLQHSASAFSERFAAASASAFIERLCGGFSFSVQRAHCDSFSFSFHERLCGSFSFSFSFSVQRAPVRQLQL